MAKWLLSAVLLCPIEFHPQRMVEQLGDADPQVREAGSRALEGIGVDALGTLHRATEHPDPEIRTRATALIRRIDHSSIAGPLAFVQRPRKMRFIAPPQPPGKDAAVIEGGFFQFERSRWTVDGQAAGSVLRTRLTTLLDGHIEWSFVDLEAERCAVHSPDAVFFRGDGAIPRSVRIKGTRRWLCDVPVVFSNPVEGDSRRIGPYTLTIHWPNIEVKAEGGLPPPLIDKMLRTSEIRPHLQQGRERGKGRTIPGPDDEPAIFFPEAREQDPAPAVWCGCAGEPDRRTTPPAWVGWKRKVVIPEWTANPLFHYDSIELIFHLPIDEHFEVISPPLN